MRITVSGDRLRRWLDAAEMSQAQLARLLNLDPGQVSRWCNDRAQLRGHNAKAVIALLEQRGVEIDVPQPTCRVYLSMPMAALDSASYETDRSDARSIYDQLSAIAAPVYWPAGRIGTAAGFEAPDLATERNMLALTEAEAFVYLQLRALTHPTSSHVELGMAIALRTPVTVFAPAEDSLPYTLRRFEAISGRAGVGGRYRFYAVRAADDAARLLSIHGLDLIGITDHFASDSRLERAT